MGITLNPKRSSGGGAGSANNGLSVFGGVVQLGGPLIKNSVITTTGFELDINGLNSAFAINDNTIIESVNSPNGFTQGSLANSGVTLFESISNPSGNFAGINIANNDGTGGSGEQVLLFSENVVLGHTKQILIANNPAAPEGILITDSIDNFGLTGAVVFPVNKHPEQYAQYGNVQPIVGKINQRLIAGVGNNDFIIYNNVGAGVTNQLLRIDVNAFMSSLGVSVVTLSLIYTDEGSTVNTEIIHTYNSLTATSLTPLVIYAERGSNVTLRVNINVAGAQVNLYATCCFLNVEN